MVMERELRNIEVKGLEEDKIRRTVDVGRRAEGVEGLKALGDIGKCSIDVGVFLKNPMSMGA